MPVQNSIQNLAAHGWSVRRIARELRLNRRTVARYFTVFPEEPNKRHFAGVSGASSTRVTPPRRRSELGGVALWTETANMWVPADRGPGTGK